MECAGRLLVQAFTNVLKNAAEAIEARQAKSDYDTPGIIAVRMEKEDNKLTIRISDNGIGLPPDQRHRLTEPYVTTRTKGTGLGLAIVRKILEDHEGQLSLADAGAGLRGAEVKMILPLRAKALRIGKDELRNEQERVANLA